LLLKYTNFLVLADLYFARFLFSYLLLPSNLVNT
jgi:hypothetical protein